MLDIFLDMNGSATGDGGESASGDRKVVNEI
jgi:hypothetical protein